MRTLLHRLSLRLRVFLFFAALAAGLLAALGLGLWLGWQKLDTAGPRDALVLGGVVAGFAALGLVTWVWFLFDANVARPIDILAGALRARAHADVGAEMDVALARYLGDLAPAATAAAHRLAEMRNALAESVARETARLTEEKSRLEALLADVPVGVLLCAGDHTLAFYNGAAVDLIGADAALPGLERPLFDHLREGPILLAHERLIATGDPEAATDLLCTTADGSRLLQARMRLSRGAGGAVPGYVLTLRDVTAEQGALARREQLLSEVFDRVRRPTATLSTLVAALEDGAAAPGRIDQALRAEVALLSRAVKDLTLRHEQDVTATWPLSSTRAADLVEGFRARAETAGLSVTTAADDLLMGCDGFEMLALLSGLAGDLAQRLRPGPLHLEIAEEGPGALIRLSWEGPALPLAELERWLSAPLDPGVPGVARRQVLLGHATALWPETGPGGRQTLCLPIPQARRATRRPAPLVQQVVYDFDLLSKARSASVRDTPLRDLTYVVFDTETTGLLPAQGDEIVQIAAVRIVNGRRVTAEVFDTLVNPGRSIPPASTEVHGITEAMVQSAPGVRETVTRFHKFCEGAVLIAHNAPFDMEFLRRQEAALGLRFDNPVLDTVLLSAVVYGQHEVHSLDALSHRLGIVIPEEARHTAIGDAIATADAYLKLMPMLRGRGLETFGAVLAEVRRHGRLLRDLN